MDAARVIAPLATEDNPTEHETAIDLAPRDYRKATPEEKAALWAGYDPERARAGIQAMAGTLSPEEGERMKELIYRAREEGSRHNFGR